MQIMASCEAQRTAAYDEDLRWRMVYQRYGLELHVGYRKIAENLNVDPSTVQGTIQLFETTGTVSKAEHPKGHGHPFKKLTQIDEFLILELVLERPGIYLTEIQQELSDQTGTDISVSTICNFLHKNGITRQKLTRVAVQRNEELRTKFREDVSLFRPEMFVFVDESGSDRRDTMRKFGYSLRGKPAKALQLFGRGKHVTAITAMSVDGVLDCSFVTGGVDADAFQKFVDEKLVSKLQPFNGTNPHSIVVMDNASIHHVQHVVQTLEGLGVLVYFLPPYSPDHNPIEEAFSKVKYWLKANEHTMQHEDLETLLVMAFSSVTINDCIGWIQHAGYV